VAVAEDNLHINGIIEASGESHTDRIRNAGGGGGRTGSCVGWLTWTARRTQIVRTSEGAPERKLPLVRRFVTRESKADPIFKYFVVRTSDFGEKRWEESEKFGEEDEDDGEGGEADLEAEGEQGAGSVESRE